MSRSDFIDFRETHLDKFNLLETLKRKKSTSFV